jgi:L-amino acid N-acyltransferase YncA
VLSDTHPSLSARRATIQDAARITEIYNQGIEDRVATFETEPRTVETVRGWFELGYPIVVVEAAGDVIAWANASSYRPRACYAQNAEFSVYVDRVWQGRGAGSLAMRALIDDAQAAGLEKLVSRVFVENLGSRAMLRKVGFREVGVYERHAMLDGVWRDVVIVECLLQDHTGEPHGALWQPDPATLPLWPRLAPGMEIIVEKQPWESGRSPVGYDAEIVESTIPAPWIEVRATWTMKDIELADLPFRIGDELREFFSPRHPFNVFAVYTPGGELRGWYGNVTRTTRLREGNGRLVLTWPDLVLDVVMLADGTVTLLDEDEIEASGFSTTAPWLVEQMLTARDQLLRLVRSGFFPTR